MAGYEGIDGVSRISEVESLAGCFSCYDKTFRGVGRTERLQGNSNAISLKAKLIQTFVHASANIRLLTNNRVA